MKRIILLGSTGSMGSYTLDVIREYPSEFRVVALAAHSSTEPLLKQINEFQPEAVCLSDEASAEFLKERMPRRVELFKGSEGLRRLAAWPSGDLLIATMSGSAALRPVLDAIEAGKNIGLANKEILVMAGSIVMEAAHRKGVQILPIDSEHNAIFQCLGRAPEREVRRLLLTGSGGPLRDIPRNRFRELTKEFVIRHPKWSMGKKISVDSATLMNKGLEMIEARWLFGIEPHRIEVLIHPEAVVHSMVEFVDGNILAQMGPTDMRSPILNVLSYPKRLEAPQVGIHLTELGPLNFYKPDWEKFPCLGFGLQAARQAGSTAPTVLNAADEIAVHAYLNDAIRLTDIPEIIREVLEAHDPQDHPNLDGIFRADAWARRWAEEAVKERPVKSVSPPPVARP